MSNVTFLKIAYRRNDKFYQVTTKQKLTRTLYLYQRMKAVTENSRLYVPNFKEARLVDLCGVLETFPGFLSACSSAVQNIASRETAVTNIRYFCLKADIIHTDFCTTV
jgi:hypothetical protein